MSLTCLLSIVSLLFCSPGLQLLSAFASHRTAGKESPAELVKKEEGGETKGASRPPPRSRETKGKEGVRNWAQACQGAWLQMSSLPIPKAQPALHHSSASLWRQRHESEL